VREVLDDVDVSVDARDAAWHVRAMRTFHHNGEYWYEQTRGPLARLARWVAWFGGVETWISGRRRGRDEPLFMPKISDLWREHLTPIALFGHRVTIQWFGVSFASPWGRVCIHRETRDGELRGYISRNGTPSSAHVWLFNPPAAVVRSARGVDEDYQYFRKRLNDLGLS
jgi:hypothetical protein